MGDGFIPLGGRAIGQCTLKKNRTKITWRWVDCVTMRKRKGPKKKKGKKMECKCDRCGVVVVTLAAGSKIIRPRPTLFCNPCWVAILKERREEIKKTDPFADFSDFFGRGFSKKGGM